jgi:hypothetical protein
MHEAFVTDYEALLKCCTTKGKMPFSLFLQYDGGQRIHIPGCREKFNNVQHMIDCLNFVYSAKLIEAIEIHFEET